jgi:uncharacterized repeat protein (TIGR03837 family)
LGRRLRYDIFCRVVDNFGDIGVTWRLARQLRREHGIEVRLIVDDLASFQKIVPGVDRAVDAQRIDEVEIVRWRDDLSLASSADCVIEAFACNLPPAYEKAMAAQTVVRAKPPVWINFEYLSAEPWVASHHLMASPHPQLPLTKHFFFPGFVDGTGGLIRERDLTIATAIPGNTERINVWMFGYENAAADSLVSTITASPNTHVTIPQGKLAAQLTANHSITVASFVPQEKFDGVLSKHDVLFVRGEDSFVRAQWAARPFIWQIYPQAEGAHWVKLNAFLDLYCVGLDANAAAALREMWRAWNAADSPAIGPAWVAFVNHRQTLGAHALSWAKRQQERLDLASNLVTFVEKTAKI